MNSEQAQAMVTAVTCVTLDKLRESNPLAFYEIVAAARDRSHVLWGYVSELQGFKLIDGVDGRGVPRIHDSVRQAILDLVAGDDLEM